MPGKKLYRTFPEKIIASNIPVPADGNCVQSVCRSGAGSALGGAEKHWAMKVLTCFPSLLHMHFFLHSATLNYAVNLECRAFSRF
jgi:hypothetical protein